MQKSFFIIEKIKNTESAQLWKGERVSTRCCAGKVAGKNETQNRHPPHTHTTHTYFSRIVLDGFVVEINL